MLWASLILVGATCAVAAPVARVAGRAAGWWLALPLIAAAAMLATLEQLHMLGHPLLKLCGENSVLGQHHVRYRTGGLGLVQRQPGL